MIVIIKIKPNFQLVVKHSIEGRKATIHKEGRTAACTNCQLIHYLVNTIYSFYKNSAKRLGSLYKFTKEKGRKKFKPQKNFEVRWIASHWRASHVWFENFELVTGHLNYVNSRDSATDDMFNDAISKTRANNMAELSSLRYTFWRVFVII